MGDWLEPGTAAPAFKLASDQGTKVSLKDFRGQPVVLYFYPKDDTRAVRKKRVRFVTGPKS